MDIFQSRFFSVNVALLSSVGLWPFQKNKKWQLFQQIMCHITVVGCSVVLSTRLIEVWGNLDIMIECITPLAVQLGATIKALNCVINRKQMTRLLDTIRNDWSELRDDTEIAILTKYAQEGRNLTLIYTGFLYGSLLLYLAIPMIPRILDVVAPLNESRPPSYLYEAQYYVDPEEYFAYIFLHTYAATIVTMTTVMAADTMFVCYIMHVCGILAVIGHRLENLTAGRSKKHPDDIVVTKDEDARCFADIVFCIDKHYKTVEVAKVIESTYSISYLLVLGISVVLLSLSAVQLLIKFGQVEEMIRLFLFNAGQCNHLFFSSWPCQRLIDQSSKFRESLYAAEWYRLSEVNKHLLRFTMLRTIEPQRITAGKIYVLSLENFSMVIQTSMSYFTVFASIR